MPWTEYFKAIKYTTLESAVAQIKIVFEASLKSSLPENTHHRGSFTD